MSSRFRIRVRDPVDRVVCPWSQPGPRLSARSTSPESRRTTCRAATAAASSTIVSSPSPITQTSTSGVESSVKPAVAVMCSPPATIGTLGKAAAHHLDQAPDLGPVLREHAADADEIGVGLDPLDDLLAAQADGHDLVVEQRRDLERILPEAVDDPRQCDPPAAGSPPDTRARSAASAARSRTRSERAAAAGRA